jgi:hypothetical protein
MMEQQIEKCVRLYTALTNLNKPRLQFMKAGSSDWLCAIKQWDTEGTPGFDASGATPSAALTKLEAMLVQEARVCVDRMQRDLT